MAFDEAVSYTQRWKSKLAEEMALKSMCGWLCVPDMRSSVGWVLPWNHNNNNNNNKNKTKDPFMHLQTDCVSSAKTDVKKSSLASLVAPFMPNDCYWLTAAAGSNYLL